jgi:hypothetical protein
MTVPQILTLGEVADYLSVGTPAVAAWARDGLLPACARSESGELLFYRWRVERDGPKLAASEVVRFREASNRRAAAMLHDGSRLPCGCVLVGDGAEGICQPIWLCPDARALQSVERLTAAFAAAVPDDPFFRQLACVTAAALTRHLSPETRVAGGTATAGVAPGLTSALSAEINREANTT